jgi:3-hydroxybutyryl-CoA dehydratase
MSTFRQRAAAGLRQGERFSITRTFSYEETEEFGRLTRDYNPVHYNQQFAAGKGFPGLILHGLLTAAMICEIGGQVAWLASGMSFRFRQPVLPGDTVTLDFTINALDDQGRARGRGIYTNQHGTCVLECEIFGRVPGPKEGGRLQEMMAAGDPTNPLRGD